LKKFIKNNESFTCENCARIVPQHSTTSRDHCCYCLYSKHVDINPGDRLNSCKGLLIPIGVKSANRKSQIAYDCLKCLERVFNIISEDDNKDELKVLYSKVWI